MYSKAEYIARMELVGNILADYINSRMSFQAARERLVAEAGMHRNQAEATLNSVWSEYDV